MGDLPRGIPRGYFSGSARGEHMAPKTKSTSIQSETEVNDDDVAERIRQALENVDMTRREVADAVGVAEKVIHSWARLGQISKHNLPRFAEVTQTSVDYLLTGRSAPTIYTQKGSDSSIIQFSRDLSTGVVDSDSQTLRDCPVVDIVDLKNHLPENEAKKIKGLFPEMVATVVSDWTANPSIGTSLPVPILNSDAVGLPVFGTQILTEEHQPEINLSSIVAFATDVVPDRGDFCILARRQAEAGWTIGAGFFQINMRVVPGDPGAFLHQISQKDLGYSVSLTRLPDVETRDPFVIDCFNDEWMIIGVGVYTARWLGKVHRMEQTLLNARLKKRLTLRKAPN
jgi:transcriptional regulator with XRE-family HTH domain